MKTARTMIAVVVAALALTVMGGASSTPGQDRPIDVTRYVIAVDLQPEAGSFRGRTTIEFVARAALERASFDLVGLTVDSVTRDGTRLEFRREGGTVDLALGRRSSAGDTLSVTVFYGGAPRDGLLFRTSIHGDPTVFADNWPDRAHHWFPCVDDPADKAAAELRVRAPAAWSVVGVGGEVAERRLPDGRKETIWSTRRPIPVYTIVFGAAELIVGNAGALGCEAPGRRCVPVTWWMYPEDAARGRQIFRRADQIVAFFDSLIGPFPYEKLALVQSTTRYGGMENSSAIFLSEQVGQAASADALIAHEVAHQWFGDAVSPGEWPHLWLSEGFATYLTTVFFERADGVPLARQRMINAERAYMASPNAVASPVIGERPRNLRSLLNANNYQKGAWVLHMLRAQVGDETFFNSLQRYYAEYRDATALTEDFQRIVEEEHGEELGWFFEQWLYRPGYPRVEVTYSWNAATALMDLRVRQVQPGPPFRFPLDFEVFFSGQNYKAQHSIEVSEREEGSLVVLPMKPDRVVIDPHNKILGPTVLVR
ncbi:MAG: M1 family metallopeptidase [Gemmatimonadetes bacterium]|uniref:Aminopeptidase N n=1 Tax=Candidatus Kutchimonas denitrificans TaxID=3056748 RepID=A0AAE4ZD15_9BACT|nr:M1 family metallopeptidase [Gemmatimonadota bacterium]NIR76526.1 M1 family metallopeptidase [Candidatus Kutchimonas denitrificans]NIS03344.1 M1 family metallopeptidase [Gemmatimonadota bacterium]NIT69205.1 M1 family metallopeptidase [Gemmatimonadota bacterium]NIU54597.1 hypothetical protein [Gemmatimonadota bacterium]